MNLSTNGAYSNISVASYLLLLREKAGVTQADLAIQAGITPAYLSMIENGKRLPSPTVMMRLVRQVNRAYRSF
jgi:transcriptional regulator with XRE-family HTH domain